MSEERESNTIIVGSLLSFAFMYALRLWPRDLFFVEFIFQLMTIKSEAAELFLNRNPFNSIGDEVAIAQSDTVIAF